jgi:hypothetical protein
VFTRPNAAPGMSSIRRGCVCDILLVPAHGAWIPDYAG